MLRHVFALAAAASLGALACGSAPSEESIGEANSALFTSPHVTMYCASSRVDAYRQDHTCGQIPASIPGGQWTIERLFPEETNPLVHDHFCAYTWVPAATSCQSVSVDTLGLVQFSDAWTVSAGCTDGAACSGEQISATERLQNIEPERAFGCPWPSPPNAWCTDPWGGSCTTCGVVVGDKAFLLNPDGPSSNAVTFDVLADGSTNQLLAKPEVVKHQFDVKPTHAVFAAPLTPGITYQNGRITSWKTQLQPFYQVPVILRGH